jgi:hypothetical protein
MTMDIDSTICGVHGHAKQGAAYGYTKVLGYHLLLATRAQTGEVLDVRMRKGSANTGRGAERFVNELVDRVRRAGAAGQLTLRGDSGFWSQHVTGPCRRHRVRFSITVRQTTRVHAAIEAIAENAWVEIAYSPGAVAQVAETVLGDDRLIVRRVRNLDDQGELFFDWRFHAFVTDRPGDLFALEGRPSRPCRGRAGDPRPQGRVGASSLSLGPLPRQRRLAGADRSGSQPGPVGGIAGVGASYPAGGQDPAPPADHPAGEMDHIGASQPALAAAGLAFGAVVHGRPGAAAHSALRRLIQPPLQPPSVPRASDEHVSIPVVAAFHRSPPTRRHASSHRSSQPSRITGARFSGCPASSLDNSPCRPCGYPDGGFRLSTRVERTYIRGGFGSHGSTIISEPSALRVPNRAEMAAP